MRYFGSHISAGGKLTNIPKIAKDLDINSIQIHPTAPQRWNLKEKSLLDIQDFAQSLKESCIKKILFHSIYLINLARKNKQMFHLSKMSIVNDLRFVENLQNEINKLNIDIEIIGVCFHPGAAIDLNAQQGLEQISKGLNWIISNTNYGKILLETSAGAGNILGDQFEELKQMTDLVDNKKRIGYVIDTQHTFASGYDWINQKDNILDQIDKLLELKNISAFHLNDSATKLNSHKDRHANLGEGEIGLDAIKALINDQRVRNIPFILETPALKEKFNIKVEVDTLRRIIE